MYGIPVCCGKFFVFKRCQNDWGVLLRNYHCGKFHYIRKQPKHGLSRGLDLRS